MPSHTVNPNQRSARPLIARLKATVVFAGPIEFEPKLHVKTHRACILRVANRSYRTFPSPHAFPATPVVADLTQCLIKCQRSCDGPELAAFWTPVSRLCKTVALVKLSMQMSA